MTSSRRPRRCWFCGRRHVAADDPPEHIIPAALGAELTTDAVAEECNRRAGKEIDRPLVEDPFIAFNRVFYDVRDRRGGRPPNPARNATLADGSPAILETREIPWRATAVTQIRDEGSRLTIKASSLEEAEEIIAKKSERTGQRFRIVDERRSKKDHVEVHFTITLDTRLRIRARAKFVLGALSRVLPDDWLDSPDAVQLLEWLWDPRPKRDGEEIGAMHASPEGLLGFMCEPPEHLIALAPGGNDELLVMVTIFGKDFMPYEVRLGDLEMPETCWVMDPRRRKVRELRYIELVHEVGRRLDRSGPQRPNT
jgi:hypothetical protein